jgi:hypothetical protein
MLPTPTQSRQPLHRFQVKLLRLRRKVNRSHSLTRTSTSQRRHPLFQHRLFPQVTAYSPTKKRLNTETRTAISSMTSKSKLWKAKSALRPDTKLELGSSMRKVTRSKVLEMLALHRPTRTLKVLTARLLPLLSPMWTSPLFGMMLRPMRARRTVLQDLRPVRLSLQVKEMKLLLHEV